jgi:SAM-dependent methyltransferase
MTLGQREANDRLWARSGLVGKYRGRTLRPAEVILLARYRDELSGRVLELGPGAGRLTGYLDQLAEQVTAMDVAPEMVAETARTYPGVRVEQGDLREVSRFGEGSFDAVVGGWNVIDVLDHPERGRLLDDLHALITDGGLLVISSHNLAAADSITDSLSLRGRNPVRAAATLVRLPRWLRNRRRVLPDERREGDHAVLNDSSHDFEALHYYIGRDDQEKQLAEHGFELLECLELDGDEVPAGSDGRSTELHYVARRTGSATTPSPS